MSGHNAPKPTIFKIEPIPQEDVPENSGGVLADVGKFVTEGVQAIKDLVNPKKPSTSYGKPQTYSLGNIILLHAFKAEIELKNE